MRDNGILCHWVGSPFERHNCTIYNINTPRHAENPRVVRVTVEEIVRQVHRGNVMNGG